MSKVFFENFRKETKNSAFSAAFLSLFLMPPALTFPAGLTHGKKDAVMKKTGGCREAKTRKATYSRRRKKLDFVASVQQKHEAGASYAGAVQTSRRLRSRSLQLSSFRRRYSGLHCLSRQCEIRHRLERSHDPCAALCLGVRLSGFRASVFAGRSNICIILTATKKQSAFRALFFYWLCYSSSCVPQLIYPIFSCRVCKKS